MNQEIGFAGPADVLCLGGMELSGSEDSLFTWEASSYGHLDIDVENLATGSSCFLGRASRSFPKRSFKLYVVSSSIVAWGNLGERMVGCYKRLLLQEVDEKMIWRNVKKTVEKMKKGMEIKFVQASARVTFDSNSQIKNNEYCM